MENRGTKIRSMLLIMLAWLAAFALVYLALAKAKIIFH